MGSLTKSNKGYYSILCCFLLFTIGVSAQLKINRQALVSRHNVYNTNVDSLSSLSVGNGRFAFTVDVTSLQSFPHVYAKGVPLSKQSEWGWHSFIDTVGYKREPALKTYNLNGRNVTYAVQSNSPDSTKSAANWFRQNPHTLLGNLGFQILKKDSTAATINDIKNISKQLNLWPCEITSRFTVDSIPVVSAIVFYSSNTNILTTYNYTYN
ncbi:MAG: hypothetical protein JWQ96_949 [Segetibacter sp.]|nr:hypothetical protein [Segetibacter sp.]